MRKETWEPKHTVNLVLVLASLTAVVLLSVFAEGAHVETVFSFVSGLLVPGSFLPTIIGRSGGSGGAGGDADGPPTRPRRVIKPTDMAPRLGVVMVVGLLLASCGASAELRASYSLEVTRCIANERAIVDRQGSTREQDEADLAIERARCDAALAAIEGGSR